MESWIVDVIRRLRASRELLELKGVLVQFRERLGFDHFIYGVRLPTALTTISHLIISDYPEAWLKEYIERNYAEVDPVVRHCIRHHEPYCWDRLKENADAKVVAFVDAAAAHGLVGGMSIGIHGHAGDDGIFSVSGRRVIATDSEEAFAVIPYLNALLPYIHGCVRRLTSFQEAGADQPRLSERELECLLWSAEGKTAEEIGIILSISSATVTFHLKNAIQKLGVTNRNQAIAKATLLGIITPQYSQSSTPRTYLF
ncbi:MAG TPA: LuxR family transcriptional regulator [Gammaproteobacteria bacterium]